MYDSLKTKIIADIYHHYDKENYTLRSMLCKKLGLWRSRWQTQNIETAGLTTEIVNFMVIFSKPLRGSRSTSRRKHHLRISVLNVFELCIYVLNMVRRNKVRQWRTVLITFLQKCPNISIIIYLWNCYTKDKDKMTTDTVTSFTPIFFLTIPLYLSLLPNSLNLTGDKIGARAW